MNVTRFPGLLVHQQQLSVHDFSRVPRQPLYSVLQSAKEGNLKRRGGQAERYGRQGMEVLMKLGELISVCFRDAISRRGAPKQQPSRTYVARQYIYCRGICWTNFTTLCWTIYDFNEWFYNCTTNIVLPSKTFAINQLCKTDRYISIT